MRRVLAYTSLAGALLAHAGVAAAGGPGSGAGNTPSSGPGTTTGDLQPPPEVMDRQPTSARGRYAERNRGVPPYFGKLPQPGSAERSPFEISGYVQPTFGLRYRPDGVPRDKIDYSAAGTRTGLVITGEPIRRWTYNFHVVATGEILASLRGNQDLGVPGGGSDEEVPIFSSVGTARGGGLVGSINNLSSAVEFEEASIGFQPWDPIGIRVGQMRIPFTAQQQSPSTALMFPSRSGPNEVFLRGSDLGGLITYNYRERLQLHAGVFNGSNLTGTEDNEQGVLYTARADFNFFGAFPFDESDYARSDLRVGIGAGAVFMPADVYDRTGFHAGESRDLRASVSLRLAYRGLFMSGEALRRQRTDSLSARPVLATGAYGQASYFIPVFRQVAMAPIARVGWAEEDQGTSPRSTMWTEAGGSIYFTGSDFHPDDLRLTLHYIGERRLTERESAHGVVAQIQLTW